MCSSDLFPSHDMQFTDKNAKAYKDAIADLEEKSTVNWKEYAKTRNIDV